MKKIYSVLQFLPLLRRTECLKNPRLAPTGMPPRIMLNGLKPIPGRGGRSDVAPGDLWFAIVRITDLGTIDAMTEQ